MAAAPRMQHQTRSARKRLEPEGGRDGHETDEQRREGGRLHHMMGVVVGVVEEVDESVPADQQVGAVVVEVRVAAGDLVRVAVDGDQADGQAHCRPQPQPRPPAGSGVPPVAHDRSAYVGRPPPSGPGCPGPGPPAGTDGTDGRPSAPTGRHGRATIVSRDDHGSRVPAPRPEAPAPPSDPDLLAEDGGPADARDPTSRVWTGSGPWPSSGSWPSTVACPGPGAACSAWTSSSSCPAS